MSPLRPALGFIHAREPRPAAVRAVRCPYCSHEFDASAKAMVLRCPRCTNPLRLEDKIVRHQVKQDVATVGFVRITAASVLTGQIVCGHLINSGRFDGNALVHGSIELEGNSLTTGELRGRSLTVVWGGTVRAKVQIGPTRGEGLRPNPSVKGPG